MNFLGSGGPLVSSLPMPLPVFSDNVNWRGLLTINVGCKRPYDRCGGSPCKFFSNAFMSTISAVLEELVRDVVHFAVCNPFQVASRPVDQLHSKVSAHDRLVSVPVGAIKRIEVYIHRGLGQEGIDFVCVLREGV